MKNAFFAILIVALIVLAIYLYRNTWLVRINDKWGGVIGGLRPSCLKCVGKHNAQAIVLLQEAKLGYPKHAWIAIGHLAEAEAESIRDYPALAEKIREYRERIISGDASVNLEDIYDEINKYTTSTATETTGTGTGTDTGTGTGTGNGETSRKYY